MQQTDEILNLKTDSHQSPALEKVMRQASKVGDDLDRLHSNVAFQSTPQFAPVLAWLVGIGMGRYSNVFAENEFDLHAVAALSEADLDSMGITALGPRRRILAEARALAGVPFFSLLFTYRNWNSVELNKSWNG
ncbi:putative serine/threonine-protein kinase drkD [Diplonema papillatum]|nr:putative serine/threonine-protein kinase drkD [Diplonema papillatum]